MLAARGKIFTDEIMQAMIGRRAVDAGHALKTMTGLEEPAEVLLAEVKERFYAELNSAVHPTPGLFVLLRHLESRGIRRAVATSSKRAYAERLIAAHGFLDHFTFIMTGDDVRHGKPDPEIYLESCRRLDLRPDRVIVLEDSPAGVESAKAAGTFAVGVPHRHSPAIGLKHADMIVDRLDDPLLLARIDAVE
jgi:HAD superfamily hydrolase (TIGR01509 family)